MKNLAVKYFLSGYSCSESVVRAAIEKGYVPEEILPAATAFSGGMGVRCLCGAVAGAQIVIGTIFGRDDKERDGMKARQLSKELCEKFMQKYQVNCCKVLSKGFEFHSPERKQHCCNMVHDSSETLENILKENLIKA